MVSRDSILRFSFLLFVFHLRAAAPTVLGAAGAALGAARPWPPPSPLSRAPPRLLINPTQKYLGPKNPEGPRFAIALLAKAHRLFRFLAGDRYGKGKSIRNVRSRTHGPTRTG